MSNKKNKVEMEKRKILLSTILNKWVYFRQEVNNEERFICMLHRSRDGKSLSKIEQIIISDDPMESGVYYITDYEIESILDFARDKEVIEIRPVRYDQEVGLFSEKKKVSDQKELFDHLINEKYVTKEDISKYSDSSIKPSGLEEIFLGFE